MWSPLSLITSPLRIMYAVWLKKSKKLKINTYTSKNICYICNGFSAKNRQSLLYNKTLYYETENN